jgi:hypothetical protein
MNSVLLSVLGLLAFIINYHPKTTLHIYQNINNDSINLSASRKRFVAILYINENSCTGCKEDMGKFLKKKNGYEWWIVTQCNSSTQSRREKTWYLESIFKNTIRGVLFDINVNDLQISYPHETRMFKNYQISSTPVVVLLDTKYKTERFIHYNVIYSDVNISENFKKELNSFKTESHLK